MRRSGMISTRQRRTDLFLALFFQIMGLFAINELRHGDYALPLLTVALSTYAASALASLYVLVVTEFKPLAFETASFALWISINTVFAASVLTPFGTKAPEVAHEARDFNPAGMRAPDEAVRPRVDSMPSEVRRIKTVWKSLPEETKKKIMDLADPNNISNITEPPHANQDAQAAK